MIRAGDDTGAEEAFEAYLAGRPVPAEAAGVAAFAEAVRSSASVPGRPSAALSDLLAHGVPPGGRATSRSRPRRPRVVRGWFRRTRAVVLAAACAVLVLAAFTGAGAAGVLPDPVQHGFATVADTFGISVSDPGGTGPGTPPADPATPTQESDDVPTTAAPTPVRPTGTTPPPAPPEAPQVTGPPATDTTPDAPGNGHGNGNGRGNGRGNSGGNGGGNGNDDAGGKDNGNGHGNAGANPDSKGSGNG
jgi:hypothetical protein